MVGHTVSDRAWSEQIGAHHRHRTNSLQCMYMKPLASPTYTHTYLPSPTLHISLQSKVPPGRGLGEERPLDVSQSYSLSSSIGASVLCRPCLARREGPAPSRRSGCCGTWLPPWHRPCRSCPPASGMHSPTT